MTKVAIVTGAAQGIGRAVALRLAADGMDIAILDLPSKQASLERVACEIQTTGRKSLTLFADVSKEQEVQDAVNRTVGIFGGLDVVYVPEAVSKFGVRAITQTAALEWGQHGITVNAYAPGVIVTPLVTESGGGSNGENYVNMLMGNAASKRAGQPEEVAALVSFLASEGAGYVTGQTISLNGGFILT
ncbi:hypothetical protein RSAG8_09558, partial [Rhizoctonia solani AG-8 WAC10335]